MALVMSDISMKSQGKWLSEDRFMINTVQKLKKKVGKIHFFLI